MMGSIIRWIVISYILFAIIFFIGVIILWKRNKNKIYYVSDDEYEEFIEYLNKRKKEKDKKKNKGGEA